MIQQYHDPEGDGMDPGLGELAYDGTEYEVDEFGEVIGGMDMSDEVMAEDAMAEDDMAGETVADDSVAADMGGSQDTVLEDGFRESIDPAQNPDITDQLEDPQLSDEAAADYKAATEDASEKPMDDAKQ